MALGGEYRAVEVERDARQAVLGKAVEHQLVVERAQALDAGRIDGAQSSADGGDGGQMAQAHGAFDHVVVGVVLDIAQMTKAEQEVDDEHQHDDVMGVGGGVGQMAKAPSQLVFEAHEGEQVLEEDEAGEGGEGLGVELEGEGTGQAFPCTSFLVRFMVVASC